MDTSVRRSVSRRRPRLIMSAGWRRKAFPSSGFQRGRATDALRPWSRLGCDGAIFSFEAWRITGVYIGNPPGR
jgi:hypothetical protein